MNLANIDWYSVSIYLGVYLLTFILSNLYSLYKKHYIWKQKIVNVIVKWIFRIIVVMPYSLLCGLRNTNVGYDTLNHIRNFTKFKNGTYTMQKGSFSYIYYWMLKLLSLIFEDTEWIGIFFMAVITLLAVLYSLEILLKDKYDYSIYFLLFLLYLSPIMMDQSRQMIAVSLIMLAISFLLNKKNNRFVFTILIASLFHESAIIFLCFVPLFMKRFNQKKMGGYFAILVLLIIAFLPYILEILYIFLPKRYEYIVQQSHKASSGFAWIIDIVPLILNLHIYYYIIKKYKLTYNHFAELICWSSIPFRYAGYFSFFIMRLAYYGQGVSIILLSHALSKISKKSKLCYLFFILIFYFVCFWLRFVVLKLNDAIPYSLRNF